MGPTFNLDGTPTAPASPEVLATPITESQPVSDLPPNTPRFSLDGTASGSDINGRKIGLAMDQPDLTPERAVRVLKMEKATRLPLPLIQENLEDVERQVEKKNFDPDRYARENPKVAAWLAAHPQHVALARDDRENLGLLERVLSGFTTSTVTDRTDRTNKLRTGLGMSRLSSEGLSPAEEDLRAIERGEEPSRNRSSVGSYSPEGTAVDDDKIHVVNKKQALIDLHGDRRALERKRDWFLGLSEEERTRYPQYQTEDAVHENFDKKIAEVNNRIAEVTAMPERRGTMTAGDTDFSIQRIVPFFASIPGMNREAEELRAKRAIAAGQGTPDDEQYLRSLADLNKERSKTDTSWAFDVVNIIHDLPAFAGELAMGGGPYKALKQGGATLLGKITRSEKAANTILGRIATGIPAAAGITPLISGPRIVEKTLENINKEYELSEADDGSLRAVLGEGGEQYVSNLALGYLNSFIEVSTEKSGGVIGDTLKKIPWARMPMANKIPAIKAAIVDQWFKTKPNPTVAGLIGAIKKHAGWHGPINEMLEEEVASGARLIVGLDDQYEWVRHYERGGVPEVLKQLSARYAAFLIPGLGASALLKMTGRIDPDQMVNAKKARQQEQVFVTLGDVARETKMREHMPEKFQELAEQIAKDGIENLYVPVEFFQTHWSEQGLDPRAVAAEMGIAKQYDEAITTGGRMEIPTAVYARRIAATEHNAVFAKELSTAPDVMNAREAEEFLKTAGEEIQEKPDTAFEESLSKVREDIRGQMIGMYPQDVVDKYIALEIDSKFATRAKRLGVDPMELYGRRPLTVSRQLPAVLKKLGKVTNLDALIDRIRSGDVPTLKQAQGETLLEFLKKKGGLQDQGGELAARDLSKAKPGLVRKTGLTLDAAAEQAVEAGYLKAYDMNELLTAIDEELQGKPRHKPGAGDTQAQETIAAAESLERHFADLGIDIKTLSNEEIKRILSTGDRPAGEYTEEYGQPKDRLERPPGQDVYTTAGGISPASGWAEATVVRGADGRPARIFRGSRNRVGLDHFDPSAFGKASNKVAAAFGVWFTNSETGAQEYAEKVEDGQVWEYHLDLRNPKVFTIESLPSPASRQEAMAIARSLQEQGHDGIVYDMRAAGGDIHFIPFTPEQVIYSEGLEVTELTPEEIAALEAQGITFYQSEPPFYSALERGLSSAKQTKASAAEWKAIIAKMEGVKKDEVEAVGLNEWLDLQEQPQKASVESVRDALVANGWRVNRDKNRSVYLSPPGDMFSGKEIRISDHALGTTRYGEQQGLKWSTDIVVNPELSISDHLFAVENEDYREDRFSDGYESGRAAKHTVITKDAILDFVRANGVQGQPLFQKGQDIKRGLIRLGKDRINIELLQNANLSTFLHELSHKWLDELIDDATSPNAPQQLKDDLDRALAYLKVDARTEHGADAIRKAVTEEHHETWARSGEAYLMEGKAPSRELRSLMATFRAWLVSIYKSLTRLNVELTPEVRGVFDRLLATDEQIEAARNEAIVQPIFTSAVEAGMTDAEFSAYQKTVEDASRTAQEELEQKLIQDFTRERKKWWKDERAKVKAEVTAEVDEQRVYKAIAALQSEGGIRLDRKTIANAYGRDFLKRLPRGVAVIEGGAHADTVAEIVGYGSGQEMLTDMANARPRNALIEAETDRRMHEEHGDLLTDGGLYDEARKAVQNELRGKVIEAEIRALNRKAREVKPFVQAERKAGQEAARAGQQVYQALVPNLAAVRAQAARIIAAKQVREVRPMAYFAAARKASRAAIDAMRKKDYLMAGHQKGMELLNLELYREANRVKDEVEASIDKLKKAFAPDAKVAKSRNVDMVNAARAILAFHGIGRADKAPMAYLEAMRRYDPEMYENMRDQVESVSEKQIDYRDMTVEEFIGMRDSVLALMHTSRRSKQMMVDGKLIDRKEAVEQLAARVSEFGDKKREAGYKRAMTKWEKTQAGLLGARAIMRRVEHWVDAMDGGDPAGVFRRYVWNPVSDAVNRYREEKKNVLQKYLELVKGVETTITRDKIDAPELGYTFNGKIELLHAVLHSGNESNLSKLLRGRGWGELREDGTLDTSKWGRFIDRMIAEKKLTKADYDFAQGVWDMLEALKPAVQKAHHDMYGYYFDEVTATPFENEFGSYRGGYVPAIVDPDIVADAAVRKDKEELLHGQNSFAFPTTGRGATMKRVEQYAKPLQLDMRTIPAHIDWAMRFAYIEPAVKDVGRLLINKDLRASLDNHDPAAARHMLMPWLQRTSNQAVTSPGMLPWLDKIAKEVRKRTGLQVMTANVINALQQLTGPSIAMVKVKPHILRNAFWQYITHPKATTEMIAEQSLFMRNRVFTQQADIIQTLDELLLNPSKYEKARAFAEKHGYFLQQGTQGFVDKVVWTGAYNQAVQQDMANTDAVRYADSVVRETQGSFSAEDISRVEAGTPFLRLFLMFYNYFNMQANLLSTEFANIATNQLGLRKGAGRALYLYIFGFMIPAFIGDGLIRALIAGEPDDDDDGYLDDYIAMFFSTQGRTLSAMVPVAGQIVMAGINMWNKKWYDDRITTSPAVSMIESSVRAPRSVYKAIVEEGSDKRAIQDTLSLIGMVSGYPVAPLARPLGYLADVRQGKASQPENVIDLTRGLVSGRDPNRSK